MMRRQILIVGGGFGGASAAVQMVRKISSPLAISVVEPSPLIGPGLAYSTDDPSFRLNAISSAHSIDVADPAHFTRWCEKQGLAESDPEARVPSGELFVRRRDFGRYLAETVQSHASRPNGSTIRHVRSKVSDVRISGQAVEVSLGSGRRITADMAILAVGNPPLQQPSWAEGKAAEHPGLVSEPLRKGLETMKRDAHVLVVGTGLTALDIIASLIARGHCGPITAISRRGLRPHPQSPRILAPPAHPPEPPIIPLDLLQNELPDYVSGESITALELLRGVRRHAAETRAAGLFWQTGLEAVSFPLSRIWPKLPLAEKRRALRHLRPYYDAHRFRTPPMTDAVVRERERVGQVTFRKAAVDRLEVREDNRLVAHLRTADGQCTSETFDAVVNCTGLDNNRALQQSPLLASLCDRGTIAPHPTGLGLIVDQENQVVTASGTSIPQLRAIGPLTAGVFGDPLGAFFISAQIHRVIPGLARQLKLDLAT
jgi:uncharacterized NAD(P)/FAD-binding protein YdhS